MYVLHGSILKYIPLILIINPLVYVYNNYFLINYIDIFKLKRKSTLDINCQYL